MKYRSVAMGAMALVTSSVALSSISYASPQKVTLTFSGWGIPTQIQAYQAEVNEYEKLHPSININTQFLPWGGNETKLIAENASKTLPDVMVTSTAWFNEFATKGSYLDLTPYFKNSHLKASNFAPGGITGNSLKGKLYMIPNLNSYPGGQVVILYNKTMFQKAHVPVPKGNWTLNKFLNVAQKLTIDANGKNATQKGFNSKRIVQWGTNAGQAVADNIWDELLPAFGGWYWNSNKTKSTIDSPAGIKAAEYLQKLVVTNASMSPSEAAGISDPFAAGKVAMSYFWTNTAESEAASVNFPVGVLELPVGPKGRGFVRPPKNAGTTTNGWAISANTKYPQQAWDFVKWLATSPIALKARGTGGVSQVAYAPLNRQWLKMLTPIERQISELDHRQYESAPVKALPSWGGEYAQFWQDMSADLQSYYLGHTSVQAALQKVQSQADVLLKQYQ